MKKIKLRWLAFYSSVLSGILTLMGVSSCEKETPDMYGTPVNDSIRVMYGVPSSKSYVPSANSTNSANDINVIKHTE